MNRENARRGHLRHCIAALALSWAVTADTARGLARLATGRDTNHVSSSVGIVKAQQTGSIFGWDGIGLPYVFPQIIGFVLFLVAAQAELTQTPFDMPVAESELVAGYMVEYTGFRFLFFFMGEFGTAFAFAGIAATLFLGGWSIPHVHGTLADVLGPIVLFTKIMIVSFLIFWARFTYPRFREDQLQAIAWKYLIPLSLLNILATGIFKVVF